MGTNVVKGPQWAPNRILKNCALRRDSFSFFSGVTPTMVSQVKLLGLFTSLPFYHLIQFNSIEDMFSWPSLAIK